MNLEAPIFQNKDFRKAMQYLFNFERLNRNLMYNEYFRQVSFFEGTEYANPDAQDAIRSIRRRRASTSSARAIAGPDDIRSQTLFGKAAQRRSAACSSRAPTPTTSS